MDARTIAKQAKLTQARLKELLHYDPLTGIFTWLVAFPQVGLAVGDVAGGLSGTIEQPGLNGSGYWRIRVDGLRYRAHRLAVLYMAGKWPEGDVDHRDKDRSNNRWLNIRPATRFQNAQNRSISSNNTSGVNGVWQKGRRWCAQINAGGKRHWLGVFFTKEAALLARKEAEARLFT